MDRFPNLIHLGLPGGGGFSGRSTLVHMSTGLGVEQMSRKSLLMFLGVSGKHGYCHEALALWLRRPYTDEDQIF